MSASFQYDAVGRRTAKTVGPATTIFAYDGPNEIQENAGSANILTGGVDEFFQRMDNNGSMVPLVDGLGSVLALVDGSGTIQTQYSYDPFGNTTTAGSASNNFAQYTGREEDGTGLYFYRVRYYNIGIDRFISEDPIGLRAGINLYRYADDNPVTFVDPFGTDVWIAGPSDGEPPFHQSINVGNPSGLYYSYSFGVINTSNPFWGVVYDDYIHGGVATVNWDYYLITTPAQDAAAKAALDSQLGHQGFYSLIGRNCRDWSQNQFERLKDMFNPPDPWLQYFIGW